MIETNDAMHQRKQLRGAESPAVFEDAIVDVFQTQASEFPENVEINKDILEIYETNVPFDGLVPNNGVKGGSRGAMAASRIKENEIYGRSFCHVVVYPTL